MRLTEADGKTLLRRHGIAVPPGVVLNAGDPTPDPGGRVVVKAQVLEGGRGKRGLVRVVDGAALADARAAIAAIAGDAPVLVEEAVAIERELYLALRVDGTRQTQELLFSAEGGVEIETAGRLRRVAVHVDAPDSAETIHAVLRNDIPPQLAARVARLGARLARIARDEDLSLLEINPLAVTKAGLLACDAKLIRDDVAGHRHDADAIMASAALEDAALTPLERRARRDGFALVEMPGDIALVSAGAGLGMLMMDLLADHGLRAACFMDNLHGGPADTTEARLTAAFEIATRPEVKGILFYTTLASRPLSDRIDGLLAFLAKQPAPKPLFVGFAAAPSATRGFDVEAATARLRAAGIAALHDDPLTLVRAAAGALA
ncbi:ATP-grasp domain-containing protein [Falsiroseomonas sp. HW251]|uniref:ATP-grasp domain-containing protein n=1 Tax=Falsiroseomonas sp. HW251 TaxID=3390998 RepID=UPI003D317542